MDNQDARHSEIRDRVMAVFGVDIDQENFEGEYPVRPRHD
jgi:hypothetical protein